MKKMLLVGLLFVAPLTAQAVVNIVACEPEWASLSKEIGGELVAVSSATNAMQDPRHIRAKPSLIAKVRKADLVVCSGADLEVGWLPILLQKAGNKNVNYGSENVILASDFVTMLEVPQSLDRANGDVHALGNPHVHLQPKNIAHMAKIIASRLQDLDAYNKDIYQQQLEGFMVKWTAFIAKLEQKAAPLTGKKYIPHHKNWTYLADWLGLKEVAMLEVKPGIAPTAKHLARLAQQMKNDKADLIIRSPYANAKASKWLAEKADIPALVLAYTVGGNEASYDLFSLYENMVESMLTAVKN